MPRDKDTKDPKWSIEDTRSARIRLGESKVAVPVDSYQGAMSKKRPSRKRDLRKIGEWLEVRRRAEQLKREQGED
jgi:hypothetical protein